MQISEQIKNYRKNAGLTQEQVANYLGVSTPAVNKWEKGNTYPDISLLPALARLLKIDMNELFSFREELTEKEIGQFVNELTEISLESFTKALEMAISKIQEYPHCDLLIYSIATVLNAALTLSDVDDEKKLEYDGVLVEWLERTADSQDEKVRTSSIFMLAAKYVQMEKYEEANIFLNKIPDTVIDATIMKTNVLAYQEGTDAAALFLEGKLKNLRLNALNIAETRISDLDISKNENLVRLTAGHYSGSINVGYHLNGIDLTHNPYLLEKLISLSRMHLQMRKYYDMI